MPVTSQRQFEIEERRKRVAANLLAGLNYRDIGEALHVDIATVSRDAKKIRERWAHEQAATIDEVVQTDLRRLDRALNAIWNKVQEGDPVAISSMLRIMERRAKYIGADVADFPIPWDTLTEDQVKRIADGEDPRKVVYGR